MDFFSTNNIMVHLPIGEKGYALSWIEAMGTFTGLLCIWLASKEKTINYLFGLINVSLFAVIFFQIQLYASLLLQIFFFIANLYGWYAWSRQTADHHNLLRIRWLPSPKLIGWSTVSMLMIFLMTFYIDPIFGFLTKLMVTIMQTFGFDITMPVLQPDALPFWDSSVMVLSMVAMILMTRKYVENWLLWVSINVISVGLYVHQGVYAMALEYLLLTLIALNGCRIWIKSAGKLG